MTNDEIREAIKDIERYFGIAGNIKNLNGIKVLLSLAEKYLKVEGWPEEQSVNPNKMVNIWAEGFNEALHICKLAAMKQKNEVSKEAIEKIVKSSTLAGYAKNNVWTNDLVVELMELINGKEA